MSYRMERVNQLLRQEISDLLQREVKDPRLSSFVAVTAVDTSPDFKIAKVYVSRICEEEGEKEQVLAALSSASRFLRNNLIKRLTMRYVPDLVFLWDNSIERGVHISEVIDRVEEHDQALTKDSPADE